MSIDFIVRIVGMVIFSILGWFWGSTFGDLGTQDEIFYALLMALLGALVGLILTPFMTIRPAVGLRKRLIRVSTGTLVSGLLGLTVGLIIAALLAFPLSLLPDPFGKLLPFFGVLLFSYFSVTVFVMRQDDIFTFLRFSGFSQSGSLLKLSGDPEVSRIILLDTSVIIDGRIADISTTGFLTGTLVIPNFVLNELQYIADSADGLRRQRGRRGMEVLSQLQKDSSIPVQISDLDIEGIQEVDEKLVVLAKQLHCPIMTNDYNLNRVAELQGVIVLNVNELANAVKAVLLPGETLKVSIIQEGKEHGQGVGYLDDGTMVVIEDGREFLHEDINVNVTKVLQTNAGRMIFARPEDGVE